ncbi:SNF2 family N-terminal domain-domain-containing protein [Absidia repens]|uniref:SNF2 family N-terminal domain-domain-containing protein n=1 Tax=Absidia repens TaxID=90262 RepID=A0A1X2IU17_9FUNG|nr:SNF2 family N-terminal domain-domain-containing protein [Absidia repens]
MVVTRRMKIEKESIAHPSIILPSVTVTTLKREPVSSQSSIAFSPPSTLSQEDLPDLDQAVKRDVSDDDFEPYVPPRFRRNSNKKPAGNKRMKLEDDNEALVEAVYSNASFLTPTTTASKQESVTAAATSTPIDRKGKQRATPTAALEVDSNHDVKQDGVPNLHLLNGQNLDTYLSSDLQTITSPFFSSHNGGGSTKSDDDDDDDEQQSPQHDSELEPDASTLNSPIGDDNGDAATVPSNTDSSDDSDEDQTVILNNNNRSLRGRQTGTRGRGRGGLSWHKRTNLKLITHHPELTNVWADLRSKEAIPVIPIEQPENLILPLLPFQRYGVAWMIQQEKDEAFKGGILADEMGMGKTIQTISLLLSDQGKKPNLVIAPTVAIMQWQTEIEKHTKNDMKVSIFHGTKREKSAAALSKYDIVITTYSVAEIAFRRQERGCKRNDELVKEKSVLHKVQWHRIILDEAHCIKDRACGTARSVFALNGNYRWALSGTPLQNRVGELYSLIRFIQADPFGYYFCKLCDCKCLNWKFSDKSHCDQCHHTPMEHVCWWNNEVLKPIQTNGYVGDGREAMDKLILLLDKMMLRRTKIQCADDLGLPPRTITVRRDMFNDAEEEVYLSLFSDTARRFNSYVEDGSVLNNYANIFELLTKMRQCANHPDLVTKKKGQVGNKQLVCMLCNDAPEDAILSACKHTFCRECCIQYLQSFDNTGPGPSSQLPKCPSCYANFTVDLTQTAVEIDIGEGQHAAFSKTSIVNRIDMDKWRSSTKIEALVEELSKLRTEDRTIKSIVFSQFVSFLDLVYWRLSRMGFCCIRLDGSMSPSQRAAAIEHFSTDPATTVFLISLKAGGVALNLTEASRVFICDPWWNPAAELQAMDRIHRLGQHRPIRITRLVIENSIESRIIQLQEKKTALVNSTIDKDQSALERLTVDDLKFLFVM